VNPQDAGYERPPVTEAIIDVRIAEPQKERTIDLVSAAVSLDYPGVIRLEDVNITVAPGASPSAQVVKAPNGWRRASIDQTEILIVLSNGVVASQLPDYPGWKAFFSRFQRDWDRWKAVAGYQKIVRVGVRYSTG